MQREQKLWAETRDNLIKTIVSLGFPAELGNEIAKNLGSPKAMQRMDAYLHYGKNNS